MADYYGSDSFRAGLYGALIHKNNAAGYAMGQFTDAVIADTTPANTEVSAALRMDASIVSIGSPGQNRITVSRFGGQKFRNRFDLGAGEFADFQIAFSDESPSLEFVTNGSLVNSSELSTTVMGGSNPRPLNLNNVGGIFTIGSQTINRTTGAITSEYIHFWMPQFTLAKVPEELAGIQSSTTDPYNSTYNCAVSESSTLQNGRSLSALTVGLTSTYRFAVRSPYKNYGLVSVIMDGTDTTFTLPDLPLSNDATGGATNWITLNGAKTAVTSVNTGTGVVTLTGAGSAGDIWEVWYPLADQS